MLEMRDQIVKAVRQAIAGSRKVRITFKREAVNGSPNYLLEMGRDGIIHLNFNDEVTLMYVDKFSTWDDYPNRTVTVTLTDQFDETRFADHMAGELERIAVVT